MVLVDFSGSIFPVIVHEFFHISKMLFYLYLDRYNVFCQSMSGRKYELVPEITLLRSASFHD